MAIYALPAGRAGSYNSGVLQGIVGGIPTYSAGPNIMDYGGDDTGVVSNDSALAAALAASSNDTAVIIPAGNFRFSAAAISWSTNRRVVRGAGMDATFIKATGGSGFTMGTGITWGDSNNPNSTITGGLVKDSTVLTVTSGTNFTNGKCALVTLPNEATTPVVSPYGYTGLRSFMVYIVSKSGNNLTIFPPIPGDFPSTTGATIYQSQLNSSTLCGLEDMTVDGVLAGTSMQKGVFLGGNTYQCWVKNVKVINHNNYGIWHIDSVCPEIRETWVGVGAGGGTNRSGMLLERCTNALIEDNVILQNAPGIEVNKGFMNSVISANFSQAHFNINHGALNAWNLYTENKVTYVQSDGYFGPSLNDIFFRNHLYNSTSFSLKRFTRGDCSVGNICGVVGVTSADAPYQLGDPNIGNTSSTGTAEPSTGDWWVDWDVSNSRVKRWTGTLTTRTSSTAGVITLAGGQASDFETARASAAGGVRGLGWGSGGNASIINFITCSAPSGDTVAFTTASSTLPAEGTAVTVWPSPSGFQEKDLDVANTLLKVANYYHNTAEMPAGEALTPGDTLAESMHRTVKPDFWGSLAWPPYDPFNPTATGAANRIPAECRFNEVDYQTPAAPVITADPVTQAVSEGDDVTLSANATGTPTPTWQWKKDGTNISGATTRFLSLLDVTDADEGSYTAVATNTEGTDTSAAGVLTVNPVGDTTPPTPNPSTITSVTVDGPSQITVVADEATDAVSTPVQYNHSVGGVYQGWQSSATRVFTGLTPSTLYSFRVKARDAALNETTQSDATTRTTGTAPPVEGVASEQNPLGNRGTRAGFGVF